MAKIHFDLRNLESKSTKPKILPEKQESDFRILPGRVNSSEYLLRKNCDSTHYQQGFNQCFQIIKILRTKKTTYGLRLKVPT
jgi:hypothetical protein